MREHEHSVQPEDIAVDVDQRLMRIQWSDGHEGVYDFETLRWQCPCAECRGEGGLPGRLAQLDRLTPQQTELVDLRLVGRYGLTPVWADGHQTGIYTFRALRAMCQCAACAAARTGHAS
ncbi:MAG TPA: DUF971 domain-containing protein [Chloroflexota bacterium]|nr:DUF971 domain-containing protein [Chloroflexota bacterium]